MTTLRLRLVTSTVLCFILSATGCGSDKHTNVVVPPDGLPAGTPVNDTETHLLARLDATFDSQVEPEYAKLLTEDFRFHFSLDSDPSLVLAYGDTWGRIDEDTSITHLFDGFQNSSGTFIPGASRIEMALNGVQTIDDSSHVDSLAYYRKIVVSSMEMMIEVPGTYPTTFNIMSRQELYLVRGDAAVLSPNQPAQPDRWYLRRWDDLAPPPPPSISRKGPVVNPATVKSLGSLKSAYRS